MLGPLHETSVACCLHDPTLPPQESPNFLCEISENKSFSLPALLSQFTLHSLSPAPRPQHHTIAKGQP